MEPTAQEGTHGAAQEGDGRRERWRTHRVQRRAELIAATVQAVRSEGPGLGMDAIASVTGIAKPVFYRYFADKADLFRAVGTSVAEAVVVRITDAIDAETDPQARIAAGIDAYLSGIEAEPELYRFVVQQSPSPDPFGDYATVVGLHATRLVGDLVRAAGGDSGVAEPWGFGLVGMVRSAGDRWLEQRSMSRAALTEHLSALAWLGMSAALPGAQAQQRPVTHLRVTGR